MLDSHAHLLPSIDDGSGSVEESIAILRELWKQGVTEVAATPHFYPDRMEPETFFENRRRAYESLRPHLDGKMPRIRLGAEVHYFEGLCHMKNIHDFRIEGSNLLLVEMPMTRWTTRMIDALVALQRMQGITVLLAHIERYTSYIPKGIWDTLMKHDILVQASADFFIPFLARGHAIRLLKKGRIHLLGTDCHNMTSRKPNMKPALEYIEKKLGREFLESFIKKEKYLLNE